MLYIYSVYRLKKLNFLFVLLLTLDICGQDVWMTPNRGQWDSRIQYSVTLNQGKLYLESDQLTFYLTDVMSHNHSEHPIEQEEEKTGNSYHVIQQHFLQANTQSFIKEQNPSSHYSNFILGNDSSKWKSGIYSYSDVIYADFYPKIDLFYSTNSNRLSYNFTVQPTGNPNQIRFTLFGANSLKLNENGDLVIAHRCGEILESKPGAWTIDEAGKKENVRCEFHLSGDTVGFHFPGGYDVSKQLIIDPSLTFSTFTGSTADNWGFTATPDINGNLFGGGIVFGTGYPLSTGAFDVSYNSVN